MCCYFPSKRHLLSMTNKFKIVMIQPNNVAPFPKLKVSKIIQSVMFETLHDLRTEIHHSKD